MQFCKCGSIILDNLCSNRRCVTRNESLTNWVIGGRLHRFSQPLTLTEAREAAKNKLEAEHKPAPPKNKFVKMTMW